MQFGQIILVVTRTTAGLLRFQRPAVAAPQQVPLSRIYAFNTLRFIIMRPTGLVLTGVRS